MTILRDIYRYGIRHLAVQDCYFLLQKFQLALPKNFALEFLFYFFYRKEQIANVKTDWVATYSKTLNLLTLSSSVSESEELSESSRLLRPILALKKFKDAFIKYRYRLFTYKRTNDNFRLPDVKNLKLSLFDRNFWLRFRHQGRYCR